MKNCVTTLSCNYFGSNGKRQKFLVKGQRLSNWQPEFSGHAESCELFNSLLLSFLL